MPIIDTSHFDPAKYDAATVHQVYNGLDCCVTLEVHQELNRLFNHVPDVYGFERALQGPYLEIMQRGFAVDELHRREAASELRGRIWGDEWHYGLMNTLNDFADAVWGKPLNPRSPAQLKDFFYKALELPEVWINQKGEKKLSTNREALEKLEVYLYARPIIGCILAIRDLTKQLSVFETEIDSDGRFRTSYNIAGTETGRPSSSENAFGTGGNAQNVAKGLRYVFVADPGYKLCNIDLEQTEARDVGYFCGCLFGDWTYLDACEGGDVHTVNSRLVWPHLNWTGDKKRDREIADRIFYRDFTYRDMAKRGSHLSNYSGSAWTMSRALKIPLKVAEEFQARYNHPELAAKYGVQTAYKAHSRWWQYIATELQTTGFLVTPFGRKRHFFGRLDDAATLREAIAFWPQSTTADRMNLGLWRVWKHMPQSQLLAQTYDSITFQYREELDEGALVAEALDRIRVELKRPNGLPYVVPGEAMVGWNWGYYTTEQDREKAIKQGKKPPRLNLDGLVKWKPGFKDTRTRTTGLQRIMAR